MSAEGDTSGDITLVNPPSDGISSIAFSKAQYDHIAVASWDKTNRIYEITPQGTSNELLKYEHSAPVLATHWKADGQQVATGTADGSGKIFDLASQQFSDLLRHDSAIKCVRYLSHGNFQHVVATAGWDKKLKYWDMRAGTNIATVDLPERAYSMDSVQGLLVVATAEKHICVIKLDSDPSKIFKNVTSPLKWQTRVVTCYPNADGYAVGSIEGRCAIQYVEDDQQSRNGFSFKCHRQPNPSNRSEVHVYAVNAISFHPQYHTFSTAGSDGQFQFWDKNYRHRLRGFANVGNTISATDFNHSGSLFAYAVSYDWSRGYQYNTRDLPNVVKVHAMKEDDAKPRNKKR